MPSQSHSPGYQQLITGPTSHSRSMSVHGQRRLSPETQTGSTGGRDEAGRAAPGSESSCPEVVPVSLASVSLTIDRRLRAPRETDRLEASSLQGRGPAG